MDKMPAIQMELLRARFLSPISAEATRGRRSDYRGERVRLNLRVSAELGQALDQLKTISGTDKNCFCEEALKAAVEAELARLQTKKEAS